MNRHIFISVCKNIIQANNKTIREKLDRPIEPPVRFQIGKGAKERVVCNDLRLLDHDGNEIGRVFYSPEKPHIKAGAKVVIEYYGEVKVVG